MSNSNEPAGKRRQARARAEQALHAGQIGDQEKADELFGEAEKLDPDEIVAVLQERTGSQAVRGGRA